MKERSFELATMVLGLGLGFFTMSSGMLFENEYPSWIFHLSFFLTLVPMICSPNLLITLAVGVVSWFTASVLLAINNPIDLQTLNIFTLLGIAILILGAIAVGVLLIGGFRMPAWSDLNRAFKMGQMCVVLIWVFSFAP